jgi:serine/threonine protein kinase
LGKGAFGQVNLVKDKHGKEFAVKEINKTMIIEQDLNEYLKGEI